MREHFPIISNICSGRITGINFLTFALTSLPPSLKLRKDKKATRGEPLL